MNARDPNSTSVLTEPRVAGRVAPRVVRIEVDVDALDLPVADLEHIAPVAGAPSLPEKIQLKCA
jgi:hypothetical protein